MKKSLLLLSLCATSMLGLAQQSTRMSLNPASNHRLTEKPGTPDRSPVKTLICQDTLRYPQAKEQILGTENFYTFNAYKSFDESISQTFLNSGSSTISGVEFYGAKGSATNVTVNASIYNVDGSNVPTTLVGGGTVTITGAFTDTDADYAYRYVTFASPLTVTGNYAIVLTPTNAGGILNFYVTDFAVGQSYDEDFMRYKSSYYPNSAGAYVSALTLTTGDATNFAGPGNFEALVAPIVSYSINTQFTPSATSVCLGTPVTYTNGTTPMSVLGNRMSSFNAFLSYFGAAATDSTFVYDMDNTVAVWNGTTTYTHPAAGSYDVMLITIGGFSHFCVDNTTHAITVNPAPAAPTITPGGPTTFCAGGSVTLTSSSATGNTWSNGATTQAITVSAAGSYTVTAAAAGCTSPASAATVITVNPAPAAPTVTPGGPTTFCAGGSVTLTSSSATGNTWSNGSTTQAITVSAAGSYTVTAAAAGCTSPASAATVITVNPLDNATYTYPTNSICDASPNQTPTTSVAGTFSATPAGLVFVSTTTGEINVVGSTSGSYTITYTTAGACPNTSSQTVVISGAPDATFTYAQTSYCTNATNPSPVFGAGASAGAFSSTTGLVINASTGAINLASSNAGTYTVTNAIAANGSCPASTETFDVTIAPTPTATVSGGGTQCGPGTFPVNIALTGAGPWTVTYTDGTTPTTVPGVVTSPYTINATANGTYTVTNVTMGACSATGTGSASVVFNTNPTVTFTPVGNVCDNASPVTLVGSPAGGSFSGSTGVSGTTFDPSGLTPGSITLTYNYTDANNCAGSATSTFTLNAAPTATLGTFTDVCLQAASFGLTGGLPAGGTYSGSGVTGGNFNPATAGVGSQIITYTATANGCSDAASQTINVEDCAGIEEVADFGLEIYPNPATSAVTIKTGKDVTFSMLSEDGKVVYPASSLIMNTETQLQVSHLAKGIYFLHFNGAQGNLVQKVIVK